MDILPADFNVDTIGDGSRMEPELLGLLREATWRRIETDPLFFLQNFWSVMNMLTFEWEIFDMREYQVDDAEWFLDAMRGRRQRRLVLKARQIGWTTLAAGLVVWDMMVHKNHPWLVASQSEGDAIGTLRERMKIPYTRLPRWLRERGPKLTSDNMESMVFDNGSNVLSIPATSAAGRSKAVFGVLMDEAAFPEQAQGMFGAFDPMTYGPLIMFSTANGMGNFFHSMWVESRRKDSVWKSRFRGWFEVPDRDEAWYEEEKLKFRGQEWLFYQENPATPEEAFAKTGRTVLDVQVLEEESHICDPLYQYDLLMDEDFSNPLPISEGVDHGLYVWQEPTVARDERGRVVQKPNYVVSCDIAEGLSDGDATSIDVFDANTGHQVASYLGWYPVEALGELLERIGRFYHQALVIPERNNMGILPITDLQRLRYPRLWRMPKLAQVNTGDRSPRYGFQTNKMTKPKGINELIRAIATQRVVIHDARFRDEVQTFIHDGKGGMNATAGYHDDKIMSVMLGVQGVLHVGEYPTIWYDDTVPPLTMGAFLGVGQKPKREHRLGELDSRTDRRRSFTV